jgi:predicted RNase H-like nuclease
LAAVASSQLRDCVGVDGCPAGWFAVRQCADSGRVDHAVHVTIASLLAWAPAPAIIGIDIPIGLLESGHRACDSAAKSLLGARRGQSVFHTPVRQTLCSLDLLPPDDYQHALATHRAVTGVGISKQAFYLLKKIAEVDAALITSPVDTSRVFEVHPEVSFAARRAAFDGQPLIGITESKHTQAGHDIRLALLPIEYRSRVEQALLERKGQASAYTRDDVLDACICLWSALKIDGSVHVTLPLAETHIAGTQPVINY